MCLIGLFESQMKTDNAHTQKHSIIFQKKKTK